MYFVVSLQIKAGRIGQKVSTDHEDDYMQLSVLSAEYVS